MNKKISNGLPEVMIIVSKKRGTQNKVHTLSSIIWKEGKYFVAQCLNIDISSFGETHDDALKNLSEAIDLYFEDNKKVKINKVENPTLVTQQVTHA